MHYLRIYPNVQASKLGTGGQSITGFRSGTDIYFVIPPQEAQLISIALSGTYVIIDQDGAIITSPLLNALALDPHVGAFGLFSSTRAERAFQANVIENWTQNPLAISFISRTEHDANSFISNSAGNLCYPFFTDTSVGVGSGQLTGTSFAISSSEALSIDPKFNSVAQKVFYYTPCMGLLVNSIPKDLKVLGGLQFCFTVSRFGDIGNQDFPVPADDVSGIFKQGNNVVQQYTRTPYDIRESNNYQIGVINPVMDIIIQPGGGGDTTSIQFNSLDIARSQTVPSLNQHFTAPFGSVLVKSLYYFLLYKPNTTVSHISSLQTSSFKQTDWSLYINGARQIYAYPTNTVDPTLVQSQFTPNSFVYNVQSTPSRFNIYEKIWNGAFQVFDYNLDGAGVLFQNVNVTFQLFLSNVNKTSAPFTYSNYWLDGSLTQDGTRTERNSIRYAAPVGTSYTTTLVASSTFLTSSSRKFTQMMTPSAVTDVVTATLNTKTLVINPASATIVPEATPSRKVPRCLQLQTAAPPSTVNRTLEYIVRGQKLITSLPGTIGYEFLLPDSGRLGNMFLFYRYVPTQTGPLFTSVSTCQSACYADPRNTGLAGNPVLTFVTAVPSDVVQPAGVSYTFDSLTALTEWSWPNIKRSGNMLINRCGYGAILGSTSLVAAVEWLLPGGVTLQRYNLQANKFHNHFGDKHTSDLLEYEFTTHVTSGYMYDERYDGKLRDIIISRSENRAFDSWHSVFQLSNKNNPLLSDMPDGYDFMQCTNLIDVDSSFRQMIGTMLTSTQKRYVRIYFDSTGAGLANISAGQGFGLFTEATLNKSIRQTSLSLFQSGDQTTLNNPVGTTDYGFPALCHQSFTIDESVPVTLNVQCIYDDPVTTRRLTNEFQSNGVTITMSQFDYQRRFATFGVDKTNTITPPIELPIGGRNPKLVNIAHKYLRTIDGILMPRPVVPTYQKFVNENLFEDLMTVPFYIASRDGAIGYSVPRNVPKLKLSPSMGLSLLTPQIDNTLMYTFPLGDSATNALMYAIAFQSPLQLPNHQVAVNASRSVVTYQERLHKFTFPKIEYLVVTIGGPNTAVITSIAHGGYFSVPTLCASALYTGGSPTLATRSLAWPNYYWQPSTLGYDSCPLMPTRFVTCLPFLPEHQNGNILLISDSETSIKNNFLGCESAADDNLIDAIALNFRANINFWNILQCMYQAKHLMAEYAILEGVQLFFNHERAEIRYLYPTGQIVV